MMLSARYAGAEEEIWFMTQTTLREYLRTTEDAISSGRIDEAMANCQNILTYFPEALDAQRLLGEVYLAQGNLPEAQQIFEWVLTNDPENVIVYCDRALISERSSDVDTALDCYQQAYELSRGNANIRQEFNQLSARVGQQEFMFSRAGLARLYMRGDLLTQAIQEWDAVLAISPERLDARLGLMETYWRDGIYDKAEAIATRLLEEIPTCLKALLFLAHMTSISNIQRARELLQRAESLDPELTVAQETFADLAARQPNDPFLELIKKEPILLEDGTPINFKPAASPATASPVPTPTPASVPNASASPYSGWDTLDAWEKQPTNGAAKLETPSQAGWNNHAEAPTVSNPVEPELPAWQVQLPQSSSLPSEQPWYQNDEFTAMKTGSGQNWNNLDPSNPTNTSWNADEQEEEQIAHPAWLDTLTRSEQQTLAENSLPSATPQPAPQSEKAAASAQAYPPAEAQPAQAATSEEEPIPFFFPSEDENEGEMGWPEWLKSLGAEALEPEQTTPSEPLPDIDATPIRASGETRSWEAPQPVETNQPAAEADPWAALPAMSAKNEDWGESNSQPDWMQQISPTVSAPEQSATPEWMQQFAAIENTSTPNAPNQSATPEWMQQYSPAQSAPNQNATPEWMQQYSPVQDVPNQNATPEWMQQIAGVGSQAPAPLGAPTAEQEQRYIASLDELEKDLQSQGFVPLAPGSLAAIAQTQQPAPAQPVVQQSQEPTLSSALAQLGNLSQPQAAPASSEPWWNSMATQQTGEQPAPAVSQSQTSSEQANPFAALGARMSDTAPQPFAPLPATPAPTPLPAAQTLASNPAQAAPAELAPAYRSDALLDSDLETTMKRPAITLQPLQAGAAQGDRPYPNGRGYERKHIEHTDDGSLSNHERLVKGYQYQLSGAYEDAMQEYRIIIRNAPELLDDVISNMRALLKINPRFSLGYRVLGDAYMRKGEYLQAMESYNKALTMAKKARN